MAKRNNRHVKLGDSMSFESDASSELACESATVQGSEAVSGKRSVYMVRGSTNGERDSSSEDNQRYLPLGIQELDDNGVDDEYFRNEEKKRKRPYKREAIDKAINSALKRGEERREVVLSYLKLMGITAFIIDAQHAATIPEIMEHVQRVITFVSKENRTFAPAVFQRCLLYQDKDGLLYNLVLPRHCAGLASKWQEYLDGFSAFQATIAVAILMRSFSCAQEEEILSQLKPAYLALLLGIVLNEEMSLSWTNAVMMVQACPSISAYSVSKDSGSDWIRKCIILLLAIAGAATGKTQVALTMIGILLACIVLLANLGSRAWYFHQWQPMSSAGPLASLIAYMTAVATGFAAPYLGYRTTSVGGKAAVESILKMAVLLALAFVISDFDDIRKFIVVGKGDCNQDALNTFVGLWFSLSLLFSIFIVARIEPTHDYPDEEPLLEEDHQSPVGFRVPNLPDFPIDPFMAKTGWRQITLKAELTLGVIMVALLGAGIVALAFTDWGEVTEEGVKQTIDFF